MDLSIVVVNYQNLPLLRSCLESIGTHLRGRLNYDVWVVDNASTDGSAQWLAGHAAAHPEVRAILNPLNAGFAVANNIALRQCTGEFVLLFNSDATLIDASLVGTLDFLRRRPEAFGCGGQLLDPDGSPGVSYGRFPTVPVLTGEILGRRYGQSRAIVPRPDEGVHTIDFPCGALFLVRRAALASVGLLDERFFLYFEETDWALQAWRSGLVIYYCPEFRAVHIGGGSSENRRSLAIIGTFYESWFLYLRKNARWVDPFLVFALLAAFFSAQTFRSLLFFRGVDACRHADHLKGLFWGAFGRPSLRLSRRGPGSQKP